jgi:hypothetical protein
MLDAQKVFLANMRDADALTGIHNYLSRTVVAPMSFDDLLRSKIVYSVSAFDKLIHDLIRVGMVQIYTGRRVPTPKYLAEPITLSTVQQLATTSTPPPEVVFEQAIQSKLKTLSFQDPDKVADGLSYIWNENQKWQRIAGGISIPEKTARTTLRLIAARRNAIVHEADMDPITGSKLPITKVESDDVFSFLLNVGNEICRLVA